MNRHAVGVLNGNWKSQWRDIAEIDNTDYSYATDLGKRSAELIRAGYLSSEMVSHRHTITQIAQIVHCAEYDQACVAEYDAQQPADASADTLAAPEYCPVCNRDKYAHPGQNFCGIYYPSGQAYHPHVK